MQPADADSPPNRRTNVVPGQLASSRFQRSALRFFAPALSFLTVPDLTLTPLCGAPLLPATCGRAQRSARSAPGAPPGAAHAPLLASASGAGASPRTHPNSVQISPTHHKSWLPRAPSAHKSDPPEIPPKPP